MNNKVMYVVLGCNGSGKTTIFNSLLKDDLKGIPYINTDEISKNLQNNGMSKASANSKSSFISLNRINEHMKKEESFIIESLMSSDSSTGIIQIINELKNNGYKIHGYFIHTKDVNINIRNVHQRFIKGIGHDVPTEVIIDRFRKTEENIEKHFKIFDELKMIDNSNYDFKEVATYNGTTFKKSVSNPPLWAENILKNDETHLNGIIEKHTQYLETTSPSLEEFKTTDTNCVGKKPFKKDR